MGNYRSAYEEYYKNLNKSPKDKDNKIYLPLDKKMDKSLNGSIKEEKYFSRKYWRKRIERELTGALILLSFFIGLKYIKTSEIEYVHIMCKQALMQNFDYNSSIDAFNNLELGNIKMKDIRIGDIKIEDLKSENLKSKINDFIDYIRNKSSIRV